MRTSDTRSSTRFSPSAKPIRRALRSDTYAWYPDLAPILIGEFERAHRTAGWDRESYGSNRWILRDPSSPRIELGVVEAGSYEFIVERLPSAAALAVGDLPTLIESPAAEVAARMQAALARLTRLEGLAESLGCLIRSAHVLDAEAGFDVSHSTPALPLSIFVSVPGAQERHADLRLAESILHEAMHLQLTLIESSVPLVKQSSATAFSPWKQSQRPVQGVLHGLYVFAAIHEALDALAADPSARDYCQARRSEIASDVAAMGDAREGLTAEGLALWDELHSRVLSDS